MSQGGPRQAKKTKALSEGLVEGFGLPVDLARRVAAIDPKGHYGSADCQDLLGIGPATLRKLKSEGVLKALDGITGRKKSSLYSGATWIELLLNRASQSAVVPKVISFIEGFVVPEDEPVQTPEVKTTKTCVLPFGTYSRETARTLLMLGYQEFEAVVVAQLLPESQTYTYSELVDFLIKVNAVPVYAHYEWGVDGDRGETLVRGYSIGKGPFQSWHLSAQRMQFSKAIYGFHYPGGRTQVPDGVYGQLDLTNAEFRLSLWIEVEARKSGS